MTKDLENPKHVKIKTYNQQKDGSVRAITESYYETLTSRKVEVIKRFPTSKDTYYTDIISASDVVASQQTNELDLLLEHLGIEIEVEPRVIRIRDEKKSNKKHKA